MKSKALKRSLLFGVMLVVFVLSACGNTNGEVGEVKTLAGAELQKIQDDKKEKEKYLVVDVRSEEEYNQGHLKFALHMPVDTFEDEISRIEDWKSKPVILYCNTGNKSGKAADILVKNGFTNVTNADGVKEYAYNLVTWGNVRGTELQELANQGETYFVDAREAKDYEEGHLKNAINVDSENMEATASLLPQDKNAHIVTYCYTGNKSAVAAEALTQMGYTNVDNSLDGTKEIEMDFSK